MINRIVLSFLAMTSLLLSCNRKEAISPEIKNITESVYSSGIVKSVNQYEVFTKTNGVVEKIFVKEGMYIKKGDPLFQIDNQNARLSAENARLASIANDYKLNSERLNDALNAVELANKKLTDDSLLYVRQQNLWNNKIGSLVEVEQKKLNFENAKVALYRAKVVYEDLKRQLTLASGQSKNNLKIAELIEDDLIVRSAVDGIVYKINIEQGELATNMSPLGVIGEENFVIELDIDEFDIVKIKNGQRVIIRMDSYKSQVFEAKVTSIYPMMNERTRTFKAEAVFINKPEILHPNLTLEANIIINEKQNALTIPTNYLANDSTVMLENGTMQKIKTGLTDYNLTEIVSGITADSKIALPEK